MRINVRVIPRSSRNEISREGETLKVHITAAPVDGAANEALLRLLAKRLELPRRAFQVVQGATGRHKVVQIEAPVGLTEADILKKLG